MSVGNAPLFKPLAQAEADRISAERIRRIERMGESELRALLPVLDSYIEVLQAEKDYAQARLIDFLPSS